MSLICGVKMSQVPVKIFFLNFFLNFFLIFFSISSHFCSLLFFFFSLFPGGILLLRNHETRCRERSQLQKRYCNPREKKLKYPQ